MDGTEQRRRTGPLAALAILFSVLIGLPSAAASAAELDARNTGVARSELGKAQPSLRSLGRNEAEADDDLPFLVGAAPRLHALPSLLYLAAGHPAVSVRATGEAPAHSYRARAPPAK